MQLKISEMMDHLLPEEEATPAMKAPEALDPDRIKALVHANLPAQDTAAGQAQRPRHSRSFQVLAAAAALFLFTGTAFAAAHYFQWDDALRQYLHPTDEQAEQLAPAGSLINQSVTDNGVTVTLNQVLGDKYGVYIVLDVVGPADAVYDDTCSFDENMLQITNADGSRFGMGYGYTAISDAQQPNHFTLIFDLDASKSLVGAKVRLQLADLRQYDAAQLDYVPVNAGSWTFDWTLEYTDMSQTSAIDAPFALYGDSDRFTAVTLSPLSLTLAASGPGIKAYDQQPDFDLPDAGSYLWEQLRLVQADGSEIPVPFASSGSSIENDELRITYSFGAVVDASQIHGLKIGDTLYPL